MIDFISNYMANNLELRIYILDSPSPSFLLKLYMFDSIILPCKVNKDPELVNTSLSAKTLSTHDMLSSVWFRCAPPLQNAIHNLWLKIFILLSCITWTSRFIIKSTIVIIWILAKIGGGQGYPQIYNHGNPLLVDELSRVWWM